MHLVLDKLECRRGERNEVDNSKHIASSSAYVKRSAIPPKVALSPSKASGQSKPYTALGMSKNSLGQLRSSYVL